MKTTLKHWVIKREIVSSKPTFIGINFMEKTISLRGTDVTFSVWDLGGIFDIPILVEINLLKQA
jgi:GTPase SAR1 family protein